MAKAPPWFPWWYGDYDGGTQHLDPVEDHVYRRLLDMQWALGGRLPSNPDRLFALVPKLRMGRTETSAKKAFLRAWGKIQDEKTAEDLPYCPACTAELVGPLPVYCLACGGRLRSPKFEQDRRGFFSPRQDQELREALESISTSAYEGFKGSLVRWGCPVKKGGCGFKGLTGDEKLCPQCGLDLWKDFNPPKYETVYTPPGANGVPYSPPNSPPIGQPIPSTGRGTASPPAELAAPPEPQLQLPINQPAAEASRAAPGDPDAAAAARCRAVPGYVGLVETTFRQATTAKVPLSLVDREILASYSAEGVPAEVLQDKIREVASREATKKRPITSFRYFREPDGGALEEAAAEWREGRTGLGWSAEDFEGYQRYAIYRIRQGFFGVQDGEGGSRDLVHPDMLARSLERLQSARTMAEVQAVLTVLAQAADQNLRRPADQGGAGAQPKRARRR
jgi:hypothetical protein